MHISKFFAENICLKDIHQRVNVLQGCLYISKASIEWDALGIFGILLLLKWVKCNTDGSTKGCLRTCTLWRYLPQ